MDRIIELKDVEYHFTSGNKKIKILDNVSYEFEQGKIYAIVGPSGSGKTTSLALMGALDIPKAGKILYDGKDIQSMGLTKFRNKHVSIVFQSYNLIPYMTALQNVVTAMEICKVNTKNRKEKATEILMSLGLEKDEINRSINKLSGGQQQRVAIARALSCDVDIVLADEPTGNLDHETAMEIIEIFQKLAHENNKCVVLVTHSNEIANMCDVTLKLNKGKFNQINNHGM